MKTNKEQAYCNNLKCPNFIWVTYAHMWFPSSLYHWKCGTIKVGIFTEMPVKGPNRLLLIFTLALWTERMTAAHSLSYEADCNPLLYSRIMCVHILKHPFLAWKHWLYPILHNCKHQQMMFKYQQIRPWKCSFMYFPSLHSPTQSWDIPHPVCIVNGLYLEEFAIFDVKIMVHKIRLLTHVTVVGLVPHLHSNLRVYW